MTSKYKILFCFLVTIGSAMAQTGTITYEYDALNRVKKVDYGNGKVITYDYDEAGNRTAHSITNGSSTQPLLSVSPTTLDFGSTQTQMSFNISNAGAGTLSWNVSEAADWITSVTPPSGTDAGTVTVTVSRGSLPPGPQQANISVTSNGGSQNVLVSLSVSGGGGPPSIRTPITAIAFGDVYIGSTVEKSTTVYNDGTGVLTITGIERVTGSSDFVASGVFPIDVSPGGFAQLKVSLTPISSGTRTATFRINHNDTNQPNVQFDVAGQGIFQPGSFPLTVESETMDGVGLQVSGGRKLTTPDPPQTWYIFQNINFPQGGWLKIDVVARAEWSVNGQWPRLEIRIGSGDNPVREINSTSFQTYSYIRKIQGAGTWILELLLNEITRQTAGHSLIIDKSIISYYQPQPVLAINPTALDFGATETQMSFAISNAGDGDLTWTISEASSWITSVSPTSGTGNGTVTVQVDRTGLPLGNQQASISISSNGGNAEVTALINVTQLIPVISSFSPTSGLAGTEVTIIGSNFLGATEVAFNGLAASNFTVDSNIQIRATVPVNATRGKISVSTPGGSANSINDFIVLGPSWASVFEDNFDRTSLGSNWQIDAANGSVSIVQYPPNGKLQLYNPNGSGTNTVATLIANGTMLTDAAVRFYFDNGPEERQNNGSRIYLRYADDLNNYAVAIGEDNYMAPERQSVVLRSVVNGTTTVLLQKNSQLLAPGVYEFKVEGNQLSFRNIDGGSDIDLFITDSGIAQPGRIAFSVNEETTIIDNVIVSAPPQVPSISSFTPASGAVGTQITVTGANFTGATQVAFNGVIAHLFTVASDNEIHTTVPAGATTGKISVATPGGTATSINDFIVIPSPTISSFTPISGPVSTQVTITGNNFAGASQVTFNGVAASNFVVDSNTQIRANVPTGTTSGKISITTPGGTAASSNDFTVTSDAWSIVFEDNFDRASLGSNWLVEVGNGSAVIVNYPPNGTLQLYDPSASGTFTGVTLNATNATLADVKAEFDFDNGPEQRQNNGTRIFLRYQNASNYYCVRISEDNYNAPERQEVAISKVVNGSETTLVLRSATLLAPGRYEFGVNGNQLNFRNVNGGTSIDLSAVDNDLAQAGKFGLMVNEETTIVDNLAISAPPTQLPAIISFSPTSGPAGTQVTITGTNFAGATQVAFNGVVATSFTVTSNTEIRATVPDVATTGKISVTTSSGTASSANDFTVEPPNIVVNAGFETGALSPWVAYAYTGGTVGGDNTAAAVGAYSFKAVIGTATPNDNSTTQLFQLIPIEAGAQYSLKFQAKASAPRQISLNLLENGNDWTWYGFFWDVSLTANWQQFQTSFIPNATDPQASFIFLLGVQSPDVWIDEVIIQKNLPPQTPNIASFDPTSGAIGTQVTIVGNNFYSATQVRFNAVLAGNFNIDSNTQITATVPAGATTGKITVTTAGGTATSANDFTIVPLPTVSINDVSVTEGNSGTTNANFTVSLSAASSQAVTVSYATANGTATAGSDYVAIPLTTLTFPAGSTTQQITTTVNSDLNYELDEAFFVNLSDASNATVTDNQGQCTIVNDDTQPNVNLALSKPATASGMYSSTYAASRAVDGSTSTYWRSNSLSSTTTAWLQVDLQAAYVIGRAVIRWSGNYYARNYQIQVSNNSSTWTTVYTDNSGNGGVDDFTFTAAFGRYVRLYMTRNNSSSERVLEFEIYASDGPPPDPTLSIDDVIVTEGNSGTVNATFTASLSAPSDKVITVSYTTADSTATGDSDYVPISSTTLTFPAGTTTQQISVTVNSDLLIEPDEIFLVKLSNPTNATITDSRGQGTIVNDDIPVNLALNKPATASGTYSSTYAASRAVDGSTSTYWRSNSLSSTTTAWLQVDLQAAYVIGRAVIRWSGSYYARNYQIQVSSNGTNWSTVYTDNSGNGGVDDFTFTAAFGRYVRLYMTSNITSSERVLEFEIYASDGPPPDPTLSIDDVSVTEGNSGTVSATFTASLSAPSDKTITVSYTTAAGTATSEVDFVSKASSLTFPVGTTTQIIEIVVNGDQLVEPDETFFVNFTNPVNATLADSQGQGTIVNDDTPINLALNKPATASGTYSSTYAASRAVDGSTSTYWRSNSLSSTTIAWLQVDLQATYAIGRATIRWSSSYYARNYQIQVSNNGTAWTTVYTDNSGNGGVDDFTFTAASGRYVRLYMTRNNSSSERVFEFEVYASSGSGFAKSSGEDSDAISSLPPVEFELQQNYPNPFNPSTTITYSLPQQTRVAIKVFNLLGELKETLVDEVKPAGVYTLTFTPRGFANGLYFYVMEAGNTRLARRLLLLK